MADTTVATIPIAPMGMINAFLIVNDDATVLVDAGIAGSEDKFDKALKRHGRQFADVDLIVITHAHGDHAGSACHLQQLTHAPLLAHAADLQYFAQNEPMTYCTTGRFGRFFVKSGVPQRPYEAFTPNIVLREGDTFDLGTYGLDGEVLSTPGHTSGSLSVVLSCGRALVGDLVTSGMLLGGIARKGRAKPPPFEDDAVVVAEELIKLLDRNVETFYLGHGGPLPAAEVRRYAEAILAQARVSQ